MRFSNFQPWGNYAVLSTDYSTYSAVYSCTPVLADAISINYMWILTRSTYEPGTPAYNDVQATAYAAISAQLPDYDFSNLIISQ